MPRSTLILLLLLAAAGIAFLVLGDTEDRSDALRDDEAEPGTHTRAVLRGTGADPKAPRAAAPKAVGGADVAVPTEPRILQPVILRLAGVDGLVSFEPAAALAYAVPIEREAPHFGSEGEAMAVEVTRSGRHVLDVTTLVKHATGDTTLTFDHWDYMEATTIIPFQPVQAGAAGDVTLEPVEIVIRRARFLHGRVVDAEGTGLRSRVFLYPMRSGNPRRKPASHGFAESDGRFTLKYAEAGRYLVAGVTDDPELRATGTVVDLAMDASHEEVVLVARPGERIAGRVLLEGEPNENTMLSWGTTGHPLSLGDMDWIEGRLAWADGEVHRGSGDEETDKHGDFEVRGLSPRAYELKVSEIVGAQVHREELGQMNHVVTAPERNVLFDLRLARIDVRATLDGDPAPHVEFRFTAMGMDPNHPEGLAWDSHDENTEEDGRIVHLVSPLHRYHVTVQDDRFRHSSRDIKAPAAGKIRLLEFALRRAPPKPRLVVTLAGEGADAVTSAGFGFYPLGVDPRSQTPSPVRSVEAVNGRFVLEDVPPGSWALHVRPGRLWHATPGAWTETTYPVEIPDRGEVSLRVHIGKGGRLLLTVLDAHGRHLEATCRIENKFGHEIPAWFVAGAGFNTISSVHGLPGAGPCWVEPVLAPGTYTVALKAEGYAEETRTVKLKAGEAAALRVEMKAER